MNKCLTSDANAEEAAQFQQFLRNGLAEIDRLAVSTQIKMANIRAISERADAILATLKAVQAMLSWKDIYAR